MQAVRLAAMGEVFSKMSSQIEFQKAEFTINGVDEEIETGCYFGGCYSASIVPVGFSSRLSPEQALHLLKSLDIVFSVKNAIKVADDLLSSKNTIRTLCRIYKPDVLAGIKKQLLQGLDGFFTDFNVYDLDNEEPINVQELTEEDSAKEFYSVISEAICLVDSCIAYSQSDHKNPVNRQSRANVNKDYDRIFVRLGRQYGFQCLCCGSSVGDLQIDHVIPVSCGGEGKYENLQLLCKPCNLRKGTQTIDYRPASEVSNA